jgi:hypothetical protein
LNIILFLSMVFSFALCTFSSFYPSCQKGSTNFDKLYKTNPIGWRPKMNASAVLTKGYENKRLRSRAENKPKQTQSFLTKVSDKFCPNMLIWVNLSRPGIRQHPHRNVDYKISPKPSFRRTLRQQKPPWLASYNLCSTADNRTETNIFSRKFEAWLVFSRENLRKCERLDREGVYMGGGVSMYGDGTYADKICSFNYGFLVAGALPVF